MRSVNMIFFSFHYVYLLRIMQLLLFLRECLSFASLSAVPHITSITSSLPQRFFSGSFLAFFVSFFLEDSILIPSWKSFSVPFWGRVLATYVPNLCCHTVTFIFSLQIINWNFVLMTLHWTGLIGFYDVPCTVIWWLRP